MTTVLWMLGFCAALGFIFYLASDRASYFFNSLKSGAMIWAQVFPLVCIIIYYYVIFANLVDSPLPYKKQLYLGALFSKAELSFFFVAGVALLTRVSNIVAVMISAYTVQRLFFSSAISTDFSMGIAVFASSAMALAMLCDCLPWVTDNSQKMLGDKLREIFTLLVSFAAMASLFSCLLKFPEFHSWLGSQHTALDAKSKYVLLTLLIIFVGWLTVAMGVARQILIPLLALPTVITVSYLTQWSPTLIFVLFISTIFASLVNRRIMVYTTTRITYM